ncbi:MalY/PatB family protein [Xylocopilactobacillus apicola]|uniref:cysteine-S-conjugate beta-lyase n=1 Tax=Xylocopilactobacillus apicola TaxID=2932184 RepID=A0AAU9DPI2_9LACO|nr:MalY/PatB family protein [Xylocopilactobacillus apicola]BDR57709.1 cystathionine beta-lyase [Xylocopilactobacillus apicola]
MTNKFDFDQIIDRHNTNSVKWAPETLQEKFNEPEIKYPCWVADMDFLCPPAVREAINKQAAHGIFGYSSSNKPDAAYINWAKRRFDWEISPESLLHTPGVVTAIRLAVQTFTHPGDQVLIQRPVYYPFSEAVVDNGRKLISNSLVLKDDRYEIDFDDFSAKCSDPNTKLFILCSPHNPIGRIWTKDELLKMLQICYDNHVFVIADEIHHDLIMPGTTHHVAATLDAKYAQNLMTCTAPSKTFNLAGLQFSNVIIENPERRHDFQRALNNVGLGSSNPFALVATTAAYDEGEEWLDELREYLAGNLAWIKDYLAKNLPQIKIREHEATYLIWLDCRQLGLSDSELEQVMYRKAKVAMDAGTWFGPEGSGFMRFNMACPISEVKGAFESIYKAI